ncbi:MULTISPECIES: hypothetical protein [Klebsiella]|uniref:hypothetical protein n=1 Tax=Klebsiella TaxID=570 RepID=UPI0012B7ECD5|nr:MULTISPECIES: hypothetical protein [Klebsiella]MBY5083787.1 hypothetical protein [Klebsiella pneumoniae]MCM6077420.1 hypothetical protein [Klebsiella pneumoniae]MDV1909009.1 hypothetical protein [Klebsiella pasteurii]MDV1914788.1 hypothetical protein [Klebsiella pasteurii]QQQ26050.1 hypothetical protein JIZ39_31290 [Klebsiella grimontii]
MEERKSYGMVVLFVSVFVVFLVSIMSYSLWRDKQISAFMATNRAWGIQCDRISQVAWVVRGGERVNLTITDLPLYCSGYRFELRNGQGEVIHLLDKHAAYQQLSRQPH